VPVEVGSAALAYVVAAAATCALTPLARRLSILTGAIDVPNERKVHEQPVPTSGGIAIIAGVLVSAWLGGVFSTTAGAAAHAAALPSPGLGAGLRPATLAALFGGAVFIALVGLVDDRKEIPAKIKLALQVLSSVPLLMAGITITVVSNPFRHVMVPVPTWLGDVLTVLWVVGVTNAINLIDGLDGLAAGVSAIACVALALVAVVWREPAVAVLFAALAGAAAGFLPWNWHPARIHMGDTGAYFLGYLIGAITIMRAFKVAAAISVLVPMLVLAVPLLDTVLSPVRRYLSGRSAFAADRDHLHHRLIALGISEPRVVLLTYAVTAICGAIAFWISRRG
jgi:UDP-GlcNAc:undecaprenyl-phosphate GlcNAc-1-phosphate transferase